MHDVQGRRARKKAQALLTSVEVFAIFSPRCDSQLVLHAGCHLMNKGLAREQSENKMPQSYSHHVINKSQSVCTNDQSHPGLTLTKIRCKTGMTFQLHSGFSNFQHAAFLAFHRISLGNAEWLPRPCLNQFATPCLRFGLHACVVASPQSKQPASFLPFVPF